MNQPPSKFSLALTKIKKALKAIERFFDHPIVKGLMKLFILNEAVKDFQERLKKQLGIWGEQFSIKINRFQKAIFIGMVNAIVWAYYAGKVEAGTLLEWLEVFWAYPHILVKMFWFSILGLIGIWFFKVLRWAITIGGILLVVYCLYLLFKKFVNWLLEPSES